MLLNEKQIKKQLGKLPVEWIVVGGNILEKVFVFDDFKSAVGFVVLVGEEAEAINHHPDVTLSWGKVVIDITTHNESGLTEKDFKLAKQIETIGI